MQPASITPPGEERVVAGEGVGLEELAAKAGQDLLAARAAVVGGEVVDDERVGPIPEVVPDPARWTSPGVRVLDLHRGVVGPDHPGQEQRSSIAR